MELTNNTPVGYNKSFSLCEALNGSGLLKSRGLCAQVGREAVLPRAMLRVPAELCRATLGRWLTALLKDELVVGF